MEKAQGKGGSKECRDFYYNRMKESPFKMENVKLSESGNIALLEYIVKEYKGKKIDQFNMNAYMVKGDVWIDVHISKLLFKPEEKELFKNIIETLKLSDGESTDSSLTSAKGTIFLSQKNYKAAIYYYEKCLELEKKNKKLKILIF